MRRSACVCARARDKSAGEREHERESARERERESNNVYLRHQVERATMWCLRQTLQCGASDRHYHVVPQTDIVALSEAPSRESTNVYLRHQVSRVHSCSREREREQQCLSEAPSLRALWLPVRDGERKRARERESLPKTRNLCRRHQCERERKKKKERENGRERESARERK